MFCRETDPIFFMVEIETFSKIAPFTGLHVYKKAAFVVGTYGELRGVVFFNFVLRCFM